MNSNPNLYIHFIHQKSGSIVLKKLTCNAPRVGDEIRLGGLNNERYYKVTDVVWVYDEPEQPTDRVNVGVVLV